MSSRMVTDNESGTLIAFEVHLKKMKMTNRRSNEFRILIDVKYYENYKIQCNISN